MDAYSDTDTYTDTNYDTVIDKDTDTDTDTDMITDADMTPGTARDTAMVTDTDTDTAADMDTHIYGRRHGQKHGHGHWLPWTQIQIWTRTMPWTLPRTWTWSQTRTCHEHRHWLPTHTLIWQRTLTSIIQNMIYLKTTMILNETEFQTFTQIMTKNNNQYWKSLLLGVLLQMLRWVAEIKKMKFSFEQNSFHFLMLPIVAELYSMCWPLTASQFHESLMISSNQDVEKILCC